MQLDIWEIRSGGFHLGRRGLGMEETAVYLPSDTLFGALVHCLVQQEGPAAAAEFVAPFLGDTPPFLLSSAFPFAGSVRFFPLPKRLADAAGVTPSEVRPKDLKKISFISESLFRSILAGVPLAEVYRQSHRLQDGHLLVSPAELADLPVPVRDGAAGLWQVEKCPRVTLGRGAQNSAIYFTGRVIYAEGCGQWLGVQRLGSVSQIERLPGLLAMLGDAGLGGERSSGFGACQITPTGELALPDTGHGLWVNLSRYLPRLDEMAALYHPQAAYTLEMVGGWIDSPTNKGQRRRTLRLVAEGSLLGPVAKKPAGQMVDVQPDYKGTRPLGHPAWRYGWALAAGSLE